LFTTNLLIGVLILVFVCHVTVVHSLLRQLVGGRSATLETLRQAREDSTRIREETRVTMAGQRDELNAIMERRKMIDERFAQQLKRSEELLKVQQEQLVVLNRICDALQRK
jgi:CHASE3 domain sensor protein